MEPLSDADLGSNLDTIVPGYAGFAMNEVCATSIRKHIPTGNTAMQTNRDLEAVR